MNKNDILRRVRYIFNFSDADMISIFGQAGHQVSRAQVSDWLKKEEDPASNKCTDKYLAVFLKHLGFTTFINFSTTYVDNRRPVICGVILF